MTSPNMSTQHVSVAATWKSFVALLCLLRIRYIIVPLQKLLTYGMFNSNTFFVNSQPLVFRVCNLSSGTYHTEHH